MRAEDLSEPERRLWTGFPYGTHVDLRTDDAERDDPVRAQAWGAERIIRAQVLIDLLVGRHLIDEDRGGVGVSAVFLSGARITGRLDVRGRDLQSTLLLQGCAFDEPLVLADSTCPRMRLHDCYLPGIEGAGLVTDGDLHLRGCHIDGMVDLTSAYVGRQLLLSGSRMSNPGAVAIGADGLVVVGDMHIRHKALLEGEVSLVSARIWGELSFDGAALRSPGGMALRANHITVEKDLYCRSRFRAEGEVCLRGAQIGGQLNFNAAALSNPRGIALNADQITVGSHLHCQQGFRADGELRMVAARVGGEVRFGSTLSNPEGVALRANRMVVTDDMFCRDGLNVDGEIDLRGAHIKGQLSFSRATVRNPGGTAIRGGQLTVGSHLNCGDGFTAEGLVDLTDAHVVGELSLSGARLTNANRVALLAPRLIVDNDMLCRDGFTAYGTVCLIRAHIGKELSLSNARLIGASLTDEHLTETGIIELIRWSKATVTEPPPIRRRPNRFLAGVWYAMFQDIGMPEPQPPSSDKIVTGEAGLALIADGLHVDGDMTCGALNARGEVRLRRARIVKDLDFTDAEVDNGGGTALHADDLKAERLVMPARCDAGKISLRYGTLIELDDKHGVLPEQIDIVGLSYERLLSPSDIQRHLEWMRLSERYEPQPYDQLARSYRRMGYDEAARIVELQKERRRRDTLPLIRKSWGYLQDATIGYGYRPMRAVAPLGLIVLIGVVGFAIFQPQPIDPNQHRVFNSVLFTLDLLFPIWEFDQSGWLMNPAQEWFKTLLIAIFWLFATTVIVAYAKRRL